MASLSHQQVAPYISLLLAHTSTADAPAKSASGVLADIKALLENLDDDVSRQLLSVGQPSGGNGAVGGFLHYAEERRPSWFRDGPVQVRDAVHHVIIVVQHQQFLAFCSSEKSYQEEIARAIRSKPAALKRFADLSLLDTGLINAALIGGQARTLWLSGLHRRTAVKPDAKILSGVNLVDALSPLSDQTYAFTAVRSHHDAFGLSGTLGVTPRKASIWTRPSRDWDDFLAEVEILLAHVATVAAKGGSIAAPIPFLAVPGSAAGPVSDAYDLTLMSPELLADDPNTPPEALQVAERLAYNVRFTVKPQQGLDLRADVEERGVFRGTIELTFQIPASGEPRYDVAVVAGSPSLVDDVATACRSPEAITVYYESGHVFHGGALYLPQYRDVHFGGWSWHDFGGYAVDREKPLAGQAVQFNQIGLEDSLFSWTVKNWPVPTDGATCWLTCDDGALEVADFVAVTAGGSSRPLLQLIHVKGSHSASATRELSVSAFEVVVSQAVKNLRSLDRRNLRNVLETGAANATKRFAWTNGKKTNDRKPLLAALDQIGTNFDREVIIIQPSARRSAYDRHLPPNAPTKPAWYFRRAQLDSLLLSAQSACFDVGARLRILADKA